MGVPTDLDALADSGLVSRRPGSSAARRDLSEPARTPLSPDDLDDRPVDREAGSAARSSNAWSTRWWAASTPAPPRRTEPRREVVPQIAAPPPATESHASLIEACRAQQARARAAANDDVDRPIFASPFNEAAWRATSSAAGASALEAIRAVAWRSPSADESSGQSMPRPGRRRSWAVALSDGASIGADGLVLATPAYAAAALLDGHAPSAARGLAAIDYASVAIVTFAFRPGDIGRDLDRSGFLVPRVEATRVLSACSWASTKWSYLAPDQGDGTVILRASCGRPGRRRGGARSQDDDDLVAALLDDLAMTMGVRGPPTEVRVSRWPRSFPQYRPGHLDRIAVAEATLPPTIALAGAALRGVGVPACIHSGTLEAAESESRPSLPFGTEDLGSRCVVDRATSAARDDPGVSALGARRPGNRAGTSSGRSASGAAAMERCRPTWRAVRERSPRLRRDRRGRRRRSAEAR